MYSWGKTCEELLDAGLKNRQAYKKGRECSLWTESAQQLWGSSLPTSMILLFTQATGRQSGEILLALHLSLCWMQSGLGILVLQLPLWGLACCDLFWWEAKAGETRGAVQTDPCTILEITAELKWNKQQMLPEFYMHSDKSCKFQMLKLVLPVAAGVEFSQTANNVSDCWCVFQIFFHILPLRFTLGLAFPVTLPLY